MNIFKALSEENLKKHIIKRFSNNMIRIFDENEEILNVEVEAML